jgi:hydroxymethylglutaryl-CoA reductase
MSSIRLLNAPWRPVRASWNWHILDKDGTTVAEVPAGVGPLGEQLAYIARLIAKAPELELLVAEAAAMLAATADAIERRQAPGPGAPRVLRDQAHRCIEALHAIAQIKPEAEKPQ